MRNLVFAGALTWLLIALLTVKDGTTVTWALCYSLFLLLFLIATRDTQSRQRQWLLMVPQSILALVCIFLEPDAFQPVLLVILSGPFGHLRLPVALTGIAIPTAILGAILGSTHERGLEIALSYCTFQLFGFF